ncbi:hypothetical protein [uncultured Bacteroides sp.]|uniref:hypothetical protein n=1 Tax=uncultured Bacteroides sp. TaxID=162156 RepID=UPI0025D1E893|nr:hypothetical protein [uncultured Bacteroides sp.]
MMNAKITEEEVLAKFQAAKSKKRECLVKLEKTMKETYKKRTGKEAKKFFHKSPRDSKVRDTILSIIDEFLIEIRWNCKLCNNYIA